MRRHEGVSHEVPGFSVNEGSAYILGEGTYGTVYRAIQDSTGKMVAIKKQHTNNHERGIPSCVLRETALLTLLEDSPYIVNLYKTHIEVPYKDPFRVSMVFELLNHDLYRYANANRPLSHDKIQRIMYHMLIGLMHCHSCGVMHRDLKPHNILIDCSNPDLPLAKIADMGFGRSFVPPIRPLTQEIVTLWYRAPEVLLGYVGGHSPAVDIWSIGCIFAELYECSPLFSGNTEFEQLIKIFQKLGTPTIEQWNALHTCRNWHDFPYFPPQNLKHTMTSMPKEAAELLQMMLAYDPCQRVAAHEALSHDYFSSIFRVEDLEIKDFIKVERRVEGDEEEEEEVEEEVEVPVTNEGKLSVMIVQESPERPMVNPLRPIFRN